MEGLGKKVKDGGYFISYNLEKYLLCMDVGSAFYGPSYLHFEADSSSIRNELSA